MRIEAIKNKPERKSKGDDMERKVRLYYLILHESIL